MILNKYIFTEYVASVIYRSDIFLLGDRNDLLGVRLLRKWSKWN